MKNYPRMNGVFRNIWLIFYFYVHDLHEESIMSKVWLVKFRLSKNVLNNQTIHAGGFLCMHACLLTCFWNVCMCTYIKVHMRMSLYERRLYMMLVPTAIKVTISATIFQSGLNFTWLDKHAPICNLYNMQIWLLNLLCHKLVVFHYSDEPICFFSWQINHTNLTKFFALLVCVALMKFLYTRSAY